MARRGPDRRSAAEIEKALEHTTRTARANTKRAMRETLQHARQTDRARCARSLRIAWSRLPPKRRRREGGGGGGRRCVHLGRSPNRGTHTIHFALSQTHSARDAVRHQRYIERDGACVASFGNIADTLAERERVWRALEERGNSRAGRVAFGREIADKTALAILRDLATDPDLDLPPALRAAAADLARRWSEGGRRPFPAELRCDDPQTHEALVRAVGTAARANAPDTDAPASLTGVRFRISTHAVVELAEGAPADARTAVATLLGSERECVRAGLDPTTRRRWLAGEPDDAPAQLRLTAELASALAGAAAEAAGEKPEDAPWVRARRARHGEILIAPGAPVAVKRAALEWYRDDTDDPPPGHSGPNGQPPWRDVLEASDETLDGLTLRLPIGRRRREALAEILTAAADGAEPSRHPAPAPPKRRTRLPAGLRDFPPRKSIVQRRIVLELAHELPLADREAALKSWCETRLRGLAWHAVIHRPEECNDERNWHAHIVYSNVAVERRAHGVGWTFEDSEKLRPPTETIRTLSGNGPLRGAGRNALIRGRRADACAVQNVRLAHHGIDKVYDHRSYRDMGVQREPGTHLGPVRFRRELAGDSRAEGAASPAWEDLDRELRARVRREGGSRDAASALLEVARLRWGCPEDDSETEAKLETEERAAASALRNAGGATVADAALELLGDLLPATAPSGPERDRSSDLATVNGVEDPWLRGARAESFAHRDPRGVDRAADANGTAALELAT